jgi:TonB-dependent receptor-like protein
VKAAPLALALCALGAFAQTAEPGGLEANVEGERRKEPGAVGFRASEARDLAGTHGDAAIAAQMLPGVARDPVGSGQLVVWGAAPNETRILLDGIEVPALYHGGGLRSVVPTELVRRLQLSPAAFGAQWGRALGGVLEVELGLPEIRSVRAAIDPLDAHAAIAAPLGDAYLFGGARYSLVDRILGPSLSETAREVFPLPRYWDGQLVVAVPLREREKLELLLFGASDSAARTFGEADASSARGDTSLQRFGRLGLRYQRLFEDGAESAVVAWVGDDLDSTGTFTGPAFADRTSWAQSAGLRASHRVPLGDAASVTVGADGLFTRTHLRRAGSLTTPPREGDIRAFGEPPGVDVAFDDWTVQQGDFALFLQTDLAFGPLGLTAGFRAVAISSDVSALIPRVPTAAPLGASDLELLPEPRLQATFVATDRVRLFAAAGLHHQAPAAEDMSAVFGTPSLAASSALHFTAGANYRAATPLMLEAAGYLRLLGDLSTRSPRPTPLLAEALVQQGTGRAYGLQLVARWQGSGALSGFLSALLSGSERQDSPSVATRLFDFDQPLALTAAASYKLGRNVLGARLRYATGFPRTPVAGAFFDAQQGREEPVFGAQNSERLPAFVALDLSAARRFDLGSGRSLRLYLEVENAAARPNAEDFVYSTDWLHRGILQGLPPLALLGAEIVL